jgi:hypothetical protein
MNAEKASVYIVTKDWLRSGLSEGVNYMDFIKINPQVEYITIYSKYIRIPPTGYEYDTLKI